MMFLIFREIRLSLANDQCQSRSYLDNRYDSGYCSSAVSSAGREADGRERKAETEKKEGERRKTEERVRKDRGEIHRSYGWIEMARKDKRTKKEV
jgi:DNA replication protein DnaC